MNILYDILAPNASSVRKSNINPKMIFNILINIIFSPGI